MNDNVPIDIGGSVRMDGGPTIHGIYPARQRGAYKRFGGFAPAAGARRLPTRSPPAPRPPPPPPLALPLSLFHFFCCQRFCWTRGCEALYAAMCACRCLQQLPTPLVIAEHVIGHRPMKHSANAERRHWLRLSRSRDIAAWYSHVIQCPPECVFVLSAGPRFLKQHSPAIFLLSPTLPRSNRVRKFQLFYLKIIFEKLLYNLLDGAWFCLCMMGR